MVLHGCLPVMLPRYKRLSLEALLFVWYARMVLLVMPFRRVSRRWPSVQEGGKADGDALNGVRVALRRSDRLAPWKNRCLVKSLAGRMMLNRRKIVNSIHLGVVISDGGRLQAHAWLKAGDFEVVERGGGYTEMLSF